MNIKKNLGLVIVLAALAIVVVTGCTRKTVQESENTGAQVSKDNNPDSTEKQVTDERLVKFTEATALGTILTDKNGMALYIFTKDTTTESTCYDQCAVAWPPLLANDGFVAGNFPLAATDRKDGTKQITYNGKPLYYFEKDENPGDAKGEGLNSTWYVIKREADGQSTGNNAAKSYTLADIAAHNKPEDCWMALDGKVYDISNAGSKHPGGKAMYAGCGKDATELFNTRPMGSGTPHSDRARSMLPNYEIGSLKQ